MNNNNKIFNYVSIGVVILLIFALFSNKDSFKTIREETDDLYNDYYRNTTYTNQIVPSQPNNIVTKTDLQDLLKTLIDLNSSNGPPQGANTSFDQSKYDLIFKDIIINSNRRNINIYPNPNSYSIKLNISMDKIYKAELIDVYVPAATDKAINIPTTGNRLYFQYTTNLLPPTIVVAQLVGGYNVFFTDQLDDLSKSFENIKDKLKPSSLK